MYNFAITWDHAVNQIKFDSVCLSAPFIFRGERRFHKWRISYNYSFNAMKYGPLFFNELHFYLIFALFVECFLFFSKLVKLFTSFQAPRDKIIGKYDFPGQVCVLNYIAMLMHVYWNIVVLILKGARSVYPYNLSQILQYVKYTK